MNQTDSPHPNLSWDYAGTHLYTWRARAALDEAIAYMGELEEADRELQNKLEEALSELEGAIALLKQGTEL